MPAFGVICRELLEIPEPGLKLKSSLLLALKLGYVNCKQLQVLPRMTTAEQAMQNKFDRLLVLGFVMAKWFL